MLATSALGDDRPAIRQLVLDTLDYLHLRGDERARRAVAAPLLDRWEQTLGDHPDTLRLAAILSLALNQLNEPAPARRLGEDTLDRCRRVLGPDHMITLAAAITLTFTLVEQGEAEPAGILGQDTMERCRRVLGPNHSAALLSAAALANALLRLGESEQARALAQDTMDRGRLIHGGDHLFMVFAPQVAALASSLHLAERGLKGTSG